MARVTLRMEGVVMEVVLEVKAEAAAVEAAEAAVVGNRKKQSFWLTQNDHRSRHDSITSFQQGDGKHFLQKLGESSNVWIYQCRLQSLWKNTDFQNHYSASITSTL